MPASKQKQEVHTKQTVIVNIGKDAKTSKKKKSKKSKKKAQPSHPVYMTPQDWYNYRPTSTSVNVTGGGGGYGGPPSTNNYFPDMRQTQDASDRYDRLMNRIDALQDHFNERQNRIEYEIEGIHNGMPDPDELYGTIDDILAARRQELEVEPDYEVLPNPVPNVINRPDPPPQAPPQPPVGNAVPAPARDPYPAVQAPDHYPRPPPNYMPAPPPQPPYPVVQAPDHYPMPPPNYMPAPAPPPYPAVQAPDHYPRPPTNYMPAPPQPPPQLPAPPPKYTTEIKPEVKKDDDQNMNDAVEEVFTFPKHDPFSFDPSLEPTLNMGPVHSDYIRKRDANTSVSAEAQKPNPSDGPSEGKRSASSQGSTEGGPVGPNKPNSETTEQASSQASTEGGPVGPNNPSSQGSNDPGPTEGNGSNDPGPSEGKPSRSDIKLKRKKLFSEVSQIPNDKLKAIMKDTKFTISDKTRTKTLEKIIEQYSESVGSSPLTQRNRRPKDSNEAGPSTKVQSSQGSNEAGPSTKVQSSQGSNEAGPSTKVQSSKGSNEPGPSRSLQFPASVKKYKDLIEKYESKKSKKRTYSETESKSKKSSEGSS